MPATVAPRLTLIVASRNDNYMGDSRWRLATALNFLGERVHALGRESDVEVVVTDWGSETPLREVIPLTDRAAPLVSFLEVPPPIARREQRDSPFPEVLALNAAARRARGAYIGRIDQDILVGEGFLRFFFDMLDGRRRLPVDSLDPTSALLFANRRGIPYRFAQRRPSVRHLERFLARFGSSLKVFDECPSYPGTFWGSAVGIWLIHRDLWHQSGGYDESLLYMNHMETEMVHRLRTVGTVVDLGALVGYDFYHLDHYPHGSWWAGDHRLVNDVPDLHAPVAALNPNGEQWGLAGRDLQVARPRPALPVIDGADHRPFALLVGTAAAQLVWDHRREPQHMRALWAGIGPGLRRLGQRR